MNQEADIVILFSMVAYLCMIGFFFYMIRRNDGKGNID